MAGQARDLFKPLVHYLRKNITYGVTSGTQYLVGTLPVGALVLATHVAVKTAFNAGTTNVLIVGTLADDDALVAAAGVDETAVACTRVTPATLAGLVAPAAVTDIFAKYTQSGAAATTGEAEIVVEYVCDNDL